MRKLTLILSLVIGFTLLSCSNDDDNENQTSEFQGNWTGSFIGDEDNGTWSVTVDNNGSITGTVTSNVFTVTWDANGTVLANGTLNMTVGTATSGATFEGTMSGNDASGIWNNTGAEMNGTWTGTKN
ncbi:MAG: hypothetical protein ACK5IC_01250 [Moheibacter sp.]